MAFETYFLEAFIKLMSVWPLLATLRQYRGIVWRAERKTPVATTATEAELS